MKRRRPVFAGSWYPAGAQECEAQIRAFLKHTEFQPGNDKSFMGGIVPHAGWFFSGDIACNVINALSPKNSDEAPDIVVVFGMHLSPGDSPYIMAEGSWETPFGPLDIATELAGKLLPEYSFRIETTERFTPDNTIELQLPFVKYFFENVRILPIGVPPGEIAIRLGQDIVSYSGELDLKIKVIGSTDLTHYGPNYGFSPAGSGPTAVEWVRKENDPRLIETVCRMDPVGVINEALARRNACCPGAVAATVAAVKAMGAETGECVAHTLSYDKAPNQSFVGYAGILFS